MATEGGESFRNSEQQVQKSGFGMVANTRVGGQDRSNIPSFMDDCSVPAVSVFSSSFNILLRTMTSDIQAPPPSTEIKNTPKKAPRRSPNEAGGSSEAPIKVPPAD